MCRWIEHALRVVQVSYEAQYQAAFQESRAQPPGNASKSDVTPKVLGGRASHSYLPTQSRRRAAGTWPDLSDLSSLPAACTSVSSHPQPTNSLFPPIDSVFLPIHAQAHRSLPHDQHALLPLGNSRPQHATSPRDCRIARLHQYHLTYPNQAQIRQTWTTLRQTSWSSSWPLASRRCKTNTRSCLAGTRRWSGSWLWQEIR